MKKSKIYTRTGDKGMTSLVGGKRVSKASPRVNSYGEIDELNSFIGLLMSESIEKEDRDFLRTVQHRLFSIGSYLATDPNTTEFKMESQVSPESVERIEKEIDRIDAEIPKMIGFVLPSGCKSAALAHVCRSICRRAERHIYAMPDVEKVETPVLVFINRLSDYLFNLARKENFRITGKEINWDYTCL